MDSTTQSPMGTTVVRSAWTLHTLVYGLIVPLLLCGCVSNRPDDDAGAFHFATDGARNTQVALAGLIALDAAQTVTIARSSQCLFESNPIAAQVFGTRNPSPERVLITNTLYITGHSLLGSYLDRKANAPIDLNISAAEDIGRKHTWRFLQGLYQFLTALGHGSAVVNNDHKSIRPFSKFDCGDEQ